MVGTVRLAGGLSYGLDCGLAAASAGRGLSRLIIRQAPPLARVFVIGNRTITNS
jgi:hypothetical protein